MRYSPRNRRRMLRVRGHGGVARRVAHPAVLAIAVVAVLGAIYIGGPVLAPIACALFIMALTWPLQHYLQARMPKLVALALVILGVVVVCSAFGSLLIWAVGRVGRWLITDGARLQEHYAHMIAWLEAKGIGLVGIWAEHFNVRWLIGTIYAITGRLNTTIGFWLVVLMYVVIGLLEVDDAKRRIRGLSNQTAARALLDGCATSAAKFRKYMVLRTLMSVATGALVWAFASLIGLQLAFEWGAIAFALNYIPFVGPFVATLLPTAFALAQFESWQGALLVFACLNVIQFVIGSYVEPRASGNILAISPFLVLFSVFLWAFLWGLFGAFIGVPISIAVLTFCAQHPSTKWLADLLAPPTRVSPGIGDRSSSG